MTKLDAPPTIRDSSGLKLWAIALVWMLVTALLPALWQETISYSTDWILIGLERFFFIGAITIPFDIRDVYTDDPKLRTVPQRLGTLKSKLWAILLLLLSAACVLSFFSWVDGFSVGWMGVFASFVVSGVLILGAQVQQPKWYYSVLMDGLMILHPIVLLLAI